MPASQRQQLKQSVKVGSVRLKPDGGLSTTSGERFGPAVGLADYPVASGEVVSKAPGVGQDVCLIDRTGQVESWRLHRGVYYPTTTLTAGRSRRPLPRRRLVDWVLQFCPGTVNAELSFHDGLPGLRDLVRTSHDGKVTITVEATGQQETYRFGEPVQAVEVTSPGSRNQGWVFSMHRRFAEVRSGDYFDRFWFDSAAGLWMRECQLTRLPLNVCYEGVYFRPGARIIVPAHPHPFVVNGERPFRVLIGSGALLVRERDWWCQLVRADGSVVEFVFYQGAWRSVQVGVTGYHIQGVLTSDKQDEASCQGVLTVHRDGTFRIAGCGLVFREWEEVDISTPDLVAYKPAGSGEWLTLSDGDTSLIARYEGSLIEGKEQWWVGGQTQTPPAYESWTPYLLLVAAVALYLLACVGVEAGLAGVLHVLLSGAGVASTAWLTVQTVRAFFASWSYVRNYLHWRVF